MVVFSISYQKWQLGTGVGETEQPSIDFFLAFAQEDSILQISRGAVVQTMNREL
jgi:hypothetical protein